MEKRIEFVSNDLKELEQKIVNEARNFGTNYVTCNTNMINFLKEHSVYTYANPENVPNNIIGMISDISVVLDDNIKGNDNVIILKK